MSKTHQQFEMIMLLFQEYFSPASDIAQANTFLSTSEVCEAINQLDPSANVQEAQVFELLTNAGYTFAPEPGKMKFSLKWMLIKHE